MKPEPKKYDVLYGYAVYRPDLAVRVIPEKWYERWLRMAVRPWRWPGWILDWVFDR